VENAIAHFLVAGMLQGAFELVSGGKSTCECMWGEDGTLTVTVKAV